MATALYKDKLHDGGVMVERIDHEHRCADIAQQYDHILPVYPRRRDDASEPPDSLRRMQQRKSDSI